MAVTFKKNHVKLGLKLSELGLKSHFTPAALFDGNQINFITDAYHLGINYFDVSPSYGDSEIWLGKFLAKLDKGELKKITVATKFGEHWNSREHRQYIDQSFPALKSSLDRSIERLGKLDILMLHKTNPVVLKSKDFQQAYDYARGKGITVFGASVDDLESARLVCSSNIFSVVRFAYNFVDQSFADIFQMAAENEKVVVINHPLNMGFLVTEFGEGLNDKDKVVNAFRFVLAQKFTGVVLTDTLFSNLLKENIDSFKSAQRG